MITFSHIYLLCRALEAEPELEPDKEPESDVELVFEDEPELEVGLFIILITGLNI